MTAFAKWLEESKLEQEKPATDCAILLTRDTDHWALAYMSFILAKQAGLEPEFVAPNAPIPKKKAYVMPSCRAQGPLFKEYYEQLKEHVKDGATLYVSNYDGFFSELNEFFGFKITCIEHKSDLEGIFDLNGDKIPYRLYQRRIIAPLSAKTLASDSLGNPLLLENQFGKGKVVFFNCPMEEDMLERSYAFNDNRHALYKNIFKDLIDSKKVIAQNDFAIVIENESFVTVVNLSDKEINPEIKLNGVSVDKIYYGELESLPPCEAVVFSVK